MGRRHMTDPTRMAEMHMPLAGGGRAGSGARRGCGWQGPAARAS